MRPEFGRALRDAAAFQIGGRGDYRTPAAGELASDRRGIGKLTHPQRHVDTLGHEVDHSIVQDHVDLKIGVRLEERREVRHNMEPRESGGRRHAQPPRQAGARPASFELGLVRLLDRAASAFVKALSRFGRRQAVRRAQKQANLQPDFKLRDRFGNCRLTDVQLLRRAGEGAILHHPDEGGHCL